MPSQSYTSFSATSYSSTTSSSGNTFSTSTSSNPTGTTVHTTSQRAGQPAVTETRRYPSQQQQQMGVGNMGNDRRIEDVTDKDAEYEERMEEEYAKREGGA